ncbi:MAG: hypothetical protein EOO41_00440 [Methanobacteriota archaeon]|nr:MAG: hypothetical protein EOO41_00440 [Euryarchaeota archaeon]
MPFCAIGAAAVHHPPTGLFRNDYLAACKILGVVPHPQLLPYEPIIQAPVDEQASAIRLPSWRQRPHAADAAAVVAVSSVRAAATPEAEEKEGEGG